MNGGEPGLLTAVAAVRLFVLAAATVLAQGACSTAGGDKRFGDNRRIERVAQPGNVAASDIAFARAARDEGAGAAFRRFAADDAIVHLPNGPVPAGAWLAGGSGAGPAADWAPREVWSSCDGSLAVTFGRSRDAAGLVGSYVTAWERTRRGGQHRWTYYAQVLDDPQPPPRRRPEVPEGPNVIVVEEFDSIAGRTADCTVRTGLMPLPAPDARMAGDRAEDGTLSWRWEHRTREGGRFVVEYLREGRWQEALDFTIPPVPGG